MITAYCHSCVHRRNKTEKNMVTNNRINDRHIITHCLYDKDGMKLNGRRLICFRLSYPKRPLGVEQWQVVVAVESNLLIM